MGIDSCKRVSTENFSGPTFTANFVIFLGFWNSFTLSVDLFHLGCSGGGHEGQQILETCCCYHPTP